MCQRADRQNADIEPRLATALWAQDKHDLDVALFFATHEFVAGQPDRFEFVGTRAGRAFLYLLETEPDNSAQWYVDRVLGRLQPLRPERQSCVVATSAPHAINLPALYLRAAIQLDFEIAQSALPTVGQLFPHATEDPLLAALLARLSRPDKVTAF
jgi:hypothetical protein